MMERRDSGGFSPNGEKFSELMQETLKEELNYKAEEEHSVNYSFVYEKSAGNYSARWRSMTRAAAVVMLFCTAVMGTSIWLNSAPANAGKFQMQKIFYQLRNGLFSSDEDGDSDNYAEQSVNVFKIDSMDDIGKAKKFMPNLLVPEYVPEGYELKELKITKRLEGNCIATYQYAEGEYELNIDVQDSKNEQAISESLRMGSIVEKSDRLVCIWEDAPTDTYGVNMAKGDSITFITGDPSVDEMSQIAENLN